MSQGKQCDLDILLSDRQTFSKFQDRQLLLSLLSWGVTGFVLLELVFIGYIPDHHCNSLSQEQLYRYNVTSNDNVTYDKCNIRIKRGAAAYDDGVGDDDDEDDDVGGHTTASNNTDTLTCINGHNYTTHTLETFVAEWDLVCEKNGLAELSQSLFTIGQGIGALVFTSIADKMGRKPVHAICNIFLFLLCSGSALSPNIWVFMALRLVGGAVQQGVVIPGDTFAMELFPATNRALLTFVFGITWAICVCIMSLLAYTMRYVSWRWLCAAFGFPGVIGIVEIWYMRESIRWLIAKDKMNEAEKILKNAAKLNGKTFAGFHSEKYRKIYHESDIELKGVKEMGEKEREEEEEEKEENENEEGNKGPMIVKPSSESKPELDPETSEVTTQTKESAVAVWTLMKTKKTRNITLVIMYTWIITGFTYFGLYLSSTSLSGDRYLNFFLTSVMEFPATFVLYKLFNLYGRKKAIILLITTSAVSLLTVSLIKSLADTDVSNTVTIVLSMLGMLGVSGSFAGLWFYTLELYPTTLRNAGMGISSATSRLGGIVSPYSRLLAEAASWGPGLLFGAGCFVASALFVFLPETSHMQLSQNLDDMLTEAPDKNPDQQNKRKKKRKTEKHKGKEEEMLKLDRD